MTSRGWDGIASQPLIQRFSFLEAVAGKAQGRGPLKSLRKIPYELHQQESPEITGDSVEFSTRSKRQNQKMTFLSFWGVYSQKGRPYNPAHR